MQSSTDLYGQTCHHVQTAGGTGAGVCPVALQGGDATAGGAGVGAEGGVVGRPGGGRGQHHGLDDGDGREAGVGGGPVADGPVGQPPGILRLLVSGLSLSREKKELENNKTKTKTKTCWL